MTDTEAAVIPEEFANAAIGALLRRQMGPLARQANDQTIVEAAGQATAVLGAIWPLVEQRIDAALAEGAEHGRRDYAVYLLRLADGIRDGQAAPR